MSFKFYLFVVTCAVLLGTTSGSIFGDIFKWDLMSAFTDVEDDDEPALKREDEDSSLQNTCNCQGMKCDCCVDFNISNIIDLGGPGCVNMKYLSKEEGVLLNVSYGDSVLHSQTVTSENKKGTCMPMLSYFAEICARFSDLKEDGDGMIGCLNFEPTVLGEVTARYPVGCFKMGPDGMVVDNTVANVTEEEAGKEEEEEEEGGETEGGEEDKHKETTKKPGEDESSFLEAVNQSAQESFEFISSLLGFDVKVKKNNKNATAETSTEAATGESRRKNKNKKLSNTKNRVGKQTL